MLENAVFFLLVSAGENWVSLGWSEVGRVKNLDKFCHNLCSEFSSS